MPISFADLGVPDDLVAVLAKRGITEPFDVQAATIPDALAGRDVCGRAPTGSGKTIAFGVPLVARIGKARKRQPTALDPRAHPRAHRPDLPRARAARGRPQPQRHLGLRRGRLRRPAPQLEPRRRRARRVSRPARRPAPPGRAQARRRRGGRHRRSRPHGRHGLPARGPAPARPDTQVAPDVVVLGDARRCDQGARPATTSTNAGPPRGRRRRARRPRRAPRVLAGRRTRARGGHRRARSRGRPDDRVLPHAARRRPAHHAARARRRARRGHSRWPFAEPARPCARRHSRSGNVEALIATDVAARGIHVDGVACVLHYDTPEDGKAYLHRSGRTARAGAHGSRRVPRRPRRHSYGRAHAASARDPGADDPAQLRRHRGHDRRHAGARSRPACHSIGCGKSGRRSPNPGARSQRRNSNRSSAQARGAARPNRNRSASRRAS